MTEWPVEVWILVLKWIVLGSSNDDITAAIKALWRLRRTSLVFRRIVPVALAEALSRRDLPLQLTITSLEYKIRQDLSESEDESDFDDVDHVLLPGTALAASLNKNHHKAQNMFKGRDRVRLGHISWSDRQQAFLFTQDRDSLVQFQPLSPPDFVCEITLSFPVMLNSSQPAKSAFIPEQRRVYALYLKDAPGLHYIAEKDLIIEYELAREETEHVKFVPRPGSDEKISIVAKDYRYKFTLKRALVGMSWLVNRCFAHDDPKRVAPSCLFPDAQLELRRMINSYLPPTFPVQINWRSELVSRYFMLSMDSDGTSLLSEQSMKDLLGMLVYMNGLTDPRFHYDAMIQRLSGNTSKLLQEEHYWLDPVLAHSCVTLHPSMPPSTDEFTSKKIDELKLPKPKYQKSVGDRWFVEWEGIRVLITKEMFQPEEHFLNLLDFRVPGEHPRRK